MVQMVREGTETGCLPNSSDFIKEFEVSRRTVARDLDFLRDEERAPLAYDDARHGFRLTDETYTPPPRGTRAQCLLDRDHRSFRRYDDFGVGAVGGIATRRPSGVTDGTAGRVDFLCRDGYASATAIGFVRGMAIPAIDPERPRAIGTAGGDKYRATRARTRPGCNAIAVGGKCSG